MTPREVFETYYDRRRREGGPGTAGWEWMELSRDLEAAGLVIAPREATHSQLVSGLETSLKIMAENGVNGLSPFKDYPNPTEITRRVYREMVAAACADAGS
jgi:hypothetical protein